MSLNVIVDDSTPRVRVLTLNRPERLNALDAETLDAFTAAVRDASAPGRDIRVIVVSGQGRAFCAGSDLKWLASGVLADAAAHMRHQDRMQQAYELLEAAPQVVIAAVNGHAVAGGFELALACDFMIAAETAEIGDRHIRRNLLPSGGSTQRLPRRLGLSRALFYMLTGRVMDGREAERIGLAAMAVPAESLMAQTLAVASEIATADALALASMKQVTRRSLELPLRDGLSLERWEQYRYRSASPALAESVKAFAGGDKAAP